MDDNLWLTLLLALILYLPAAMANMAPVILWRVGCWKALRRPLDGGIRFCGQPLFGPHKTVLGMVAAMVGGAIGGLLAGLIAISAAIYQWDLIMFPYFLLWGAIIGFGAILGDLIKSFVKRRLKVKAGAPFVPWDQIDFVIGAWLAHQFLMIWLGVGGKLGMLPPIGWEVLLAGVLLMPPLHLSANLIAHKLRWKKVWW